MITATRQAAPTPEIRIIENLPLLMISTKTDCLVLVSGHNRNFTMALVGMCIHPGATDYQFGEIRKDWDSCVFVPFEGEVILRNS